MVDRGSRESRQGRENGRKLRFARGNVLREGMSLMRGSYRWIQKFIPPTIPRKNPVLRPLSYQIDHLPGKCPIQFMQIILNPASNWVPVVLAQLSRSPYRL